MAYQADSGQCPHPDLGLDINHQMLADSNVHYLEIKVTCKVCGTAMQFQGLPAGVSFKHPTASIDALEITIPILGEGEEPKGKLIQLGVLVGP